MTSRPEWRPVCPVAEIDTGRGVTALVHGQAIAVFRVVDKSGAEAIYALGNHDPFVRGSVIARGIVGERGGIPFVASPTHRHAFDLRTGKCLDDLQVAVPAFCVKVVDGVVHVGRRKQVDAA